MSFASEHAIKAVRKRHRCDGCNRHIEVGSPATRWAGMTDGDFGTAIYHPECRDAEVAYNYDALGYQYGNDWWPLYDIEREDWPWLREAHPAVADRMNILVSVSDAREHSSPRQVESARSRDELKNPSTRKVEP